MRKSRSRSLRLVLSLTALALCPASAVAAPTVQEFEIPTPDLAPSSIVTGADGNLWFSTPARSALGQSTTGGSMTIFKTGITGRSHTVVSGPDAELWFTEAGAAKIGQATLLGAVTEHAIEGEASGIVGGPDGNVWFTEPAGPGAIGRINITTGKVTEFSVGLTPNRRPTSITDGPDGAMWFTENGGPGAIGRITTTGSITEYSTGLSKNGKPAGIAAGPDGALWFTEEGNPGAIGRITTAGAITEFTTGLTADSQPTGIVAGDDGNLHFTEAGDPGRIGMITPSGTISEIATPTNKSQPGGIAEGPEGNLWFTEAGAHGKIGSITLAPGANAAEPTGVTEQEATLNAGVLANAQPSTYRFEYGPTKAYGTLTSPASAGSGSSSVPVAATVSGLSPGTTYHYRVSATNASGTTHGPDKAFTTMSPPLATTGPAGGVTLTAATLSGTADPDGHATSYHFDWGPTEAYGSQAPVSDASVGSDRSEHPLTQALSGLEPDTTYHFRLVATNCGGCAEGTAYGADETFTTAAPPGAETGPADSVGPDSARLTGSVDPNGAMSTYHFDWGPTSAYGNRVPGVDRVAGAGTTAHPVHETLEGLAPGTVYHYRLVASNCGGCTAGTTYGADRTVGSEASPPAAVAPASPLAPGVPSPSPLTTPAPAAPTPPPALGHTAGVAVLAGTILVKVPGSAVALPLAGPAVVPMGSLVDASHGVLRLTTALGNGRTQSASVWGESFKVTQASAPRGMTVMTLAGPRGCRPRARGAGASAVATAAAVRRTLWSKDSHGLFSTRGHNSVATVRGTYWGSQERCGATLTIVRGGAVSVRDLKRHRTVLVRAGHSYLARG